MRFTVTWSATANNQLASIWLKLPVGERSTFSARVDWLDKTLRENAHQKGAAIAEVFATRALSPPDFFELPTVGIAYKVSVEDRTVEVLKLYEVVDRPKKA